MQVVHRKKRSDGGGVNFWASENLSWRVHFEVYSPEWRVLSKLSVQPCRLFKENDVIPTIGFIISSFRFVSNLLKYIRMVR